MLRFVHTADWQIGMRADYVAEAARRVREARLEAATRVVNLARERDAQFILLAGDTFEDNQVADSLVHQVLRVLSDAAPLSVFILPGNHDHLGPGSIYARRPFQNLPTNVQVIRKAVSIPIPGTDAVLLPAPVCQKRSALDPTAHLPNSPKEGMIRIGVAHGSLRIEGKYQPDDFPITLDAAHRASLDYLALGHWHSFYAHDGRTVYPGTPEPTGFDERESGTAALVTIEGPGAVPKVERMKTGVLRWESWEEQVKEPSDPILRTLRRRVEALPDPAKTLLRLRLKGWLGPDGKAVIEDFGAWIRARLLFLDLDRSRLTPEVRQGRLRELAAAHPLLAGVLGDLAALGVMVNPLPSTGGEGESPLLAGVEDLGVTPLDATTLRKILEESGADLNILREAVNLLGSLVGEVWP
ncbi:MAG: DNA repair exonuclease [candidate division NC10 bacterium]|nr:DNA repair exonuclease [candidate division NC10 bacterium]